MKEKTTKILVAAVLLTVASGFIQGLIMQRWGPSRAMAAAGARIDQIPGQIGLWKLKSDQPLGAEAVRQLRCTGHTSRTYVNEKTGESINVAVMVGPAGPLVTHTPDICYGGTNFSIHEPRRAVQILADDGTEHDFSVIGFQLNDASRQSLHVYYAWSDGEKWLAPDFPRYELAGRKMLYKVQVASRTRIRHNGGPDSGRVFLQSALPELARVLRLMN